MKTSEILKKDTHKLVEIIKQWKDCDYETLIISLLELQKRGLDFSDKLIKEEINNICNTNNVSKIEVLFNLFLKKKEYYSYEEFRSMIIENEEKNHEKFDQRIDQRILEINQKTHPNRILDAGKNLKTVSIFIIISIISSFFLSIIIYNQEDTKNIHTFLFFGLFINFIFSVVIIYNLYLAGENLENYIKD